MAEGSIREASILTASPHLLLSPEMVSSDQYISSITFHGGKPVYVPFRPPKEASHSNVSSADWKLDIDELRAACTDKTKVLILNSEWDHSVIGRCSVTHLQRRRGCACLP